jgi:HAE1 family hydrophobic/amphiphilic exporter-1
LPNVDFPTVTVSANLPGTSPQTMAATVATPLEKQFSTIAGIDNMTSTSSLGQTQIVIQFALDRNIDAAAQDVQAAIAQTARQLPQGMIPPSYQKTNPADAPILTLALTSDEVPLSTLDEFGETSLAQRLSMVGGVAQVLVYGAQKYAVRLQLDPGQLATRNIALEDVAQAVVSQNVNMPTGVLYGPRTALTVQATGQLENAQQFRDVIVAYRNGAPVHLDEIGRITDDVQNNKTASWYNGSRSIVLAIQRQPGTNTVDVANRVKAALAKLQAEIPPSVRVSTLYDRSATIKASVDDVTFTLELTLVLVVAVIFLFLRNISATIIPSLALPMSIIGTFSVMYLLHYSLDNLSLMALTLAVGFVVDDAIVMLENIVRHLEMGKPKRQAAIDGAAEVGFTILSMTFSLAAVFIPFLFMGGIIGKLFHEFAVTIGVAILVSGFVSLTLTPMLSSRFLKPQHTGTHGWAYQMSERFFDSWLRLYERTLAWVMERRPRTLAFSFVILVATAYLFWRTPKGLFPTDDTGQLLATTEAAEGVSFDALVQHQQEVAAIAAKDPDVRSVTSSVGTTAAANQGQLTIDLKPIEERSRSADEIGRDLTHALAAVPDITVFVQNPPAISIGGLASKSLYQYTMQSGDIGALNTAARELERRLRQLPNLVDVTSDLLIENPQVTVDIDREQAGQLGVSASEIENTLYDAFGQRQVSTIYTSTNEYRVVTELPREYQQGVGALVTLILFGLDLDIYGFVGIIMLIGIVEKNAIMMIDFAIEAQRDGNRTPAAAILEAASVRFRPIMMTTMAALMGAVPIAVGWGAGASTRRPLGVAVVGGLAFSQLVTLYVTPVFYTYLDEWQQWFSRRKVRQAKVVVAGEAVTGD